MLPKILKKGALCLAFAAAVGGLAGCDRGTTKPGTEIDYDQPISGMTPAQIHLRGQALEAEIYQVRTEHLAYYLKHKQISQAEYDAGVKQDDYQIALRRQEFVGKMQLVFFDGFFIHELTKGGFTPPAKMPELPKDATQPTVQPTNQPAAQPATKVGSALPAPKPSTPKS